MNLYHVQDCDRPMYVLANNYGEAVERWMERVKEENEEDESWNPQPEGVQLLATGTQFDDSCPEVLLPN